MKVYIRDRPHSGIPREHPYNSGTDVLYPGRVVNYVDFKAHPEMIPTSCEDFIPYERFAAVRVLYRLLEWINGPTSSLESNDCAFWPAHENRTPVFAGKAMECSGRLMVFCRDLRLNLVHGRIERLREQMFSRLLAIDPTFEWGVVELHLCPQAFRELDLQEAPELVIEWWTFGDDEEEVMRTCARALLNIETTLHGLSKDNTQA